MIHISASQVVLFTGCARKWWYEYVLGLKRPPTPSMALGTELHRQIEQWYLAGEQPADERAALALRNLPPREGPRAAEMPFAEVLSDAVALRGIIDLVDLADSTHPVVTDHKTTSDLRYMRTPDLLRRDVQMQCYAFAVLAECPEADLVTVRHHYIHTRGRPKPSVLVPVTVDRAHVARQRIAFLKSARAMLALRVIHDPCEVEPTGAPSECVRYGGCPHRARCEAEVYRPSRNLLPPDTARRAPDRPYATIDNVSEELRDELLRTQTERKKYEEMASKFKEKMAAIRAKAGAAEAGAKPQAPAAEPARPAVPEPRPGAALYFGILPPRGVVFTYLEEWIKPLETSVSDKHGIHWRAVPYGGGTSDLVMSVEAAQNLPDHLYAGPGDLSDKLRSILIKRYAHVYYVCDRCGAPRAE